MADCVSSRDRLLWRTTPKAENSMKQLYNSLLMIATILLIGACTPPTEDSSKTTQTIAEPVSPPSAEVIHQNALVLDAHADIEIPGKESRYAGSDGKSKVSPEKMKAGGVDAVVMAIAVGPGPRNAEGYAQARATADAELAAVLAMDADTTNNVVLVRSADELIKAHADGKSALILSFQNARILGEDVSALDEFYAAGVRGFALTHMGHNAFADSSRPIFNGETGKHEPVEEHGGLSELGRMAIKRINNNS